MIEDQKIARLWYEIKNMPRYDIEWEWISEQKNGQYLYRKDVLNLVEKFLNEKEKK